MDPALKITACTTTEGKKVVVVVHYGVVVEVCSPFCFECATAEEFLATAKNFPLADQQSGEVLCPADHALIASMLGPVPVPEIPIRRGSKKPLDPTRLAKLGGTGTPFAAIQTDDDGTVRCIRFNSVVDAYQYRLYVHREWEESTITSYSIYELKATPEGKEMYFHVIFTLPEYDEALETLFETISP